MRQATTTSMDGMFMHGYVDDHGNGIGVGGQIGVLWAGGYMLEVAGL